VFAQVGGKALYRAGILACGEERDPPRLHVGDPVRLLQEMRMAQQTLSEFAAQGIRAEAAPAEESGVAAFLTSLASAWKEGEARPTHRKQHKAKHWWRSRVDPFADAWPVIEGWLVAEPTVPAKESMDRLAMMVPDAYAHKAQLRTLQRRLKAWRAEHVREMVSWEACESLPKRRLMRELGEGAGRCAPRKPRKKGGNKNETTIIRRVTFLREATQSDVVVDEYPPRLELSSIRTTVVLFQAQSEPRQALR
jgi:hypothetical protein